MRRGSFLCPSLIYLAGSVRSEGPSLKQGPPKFGPRTERTIEGWTVRTDDRILKEPGDAVGKPVLRFLENKLADITVIVPKEPLKKLQLVVIVLDRRYAPTR